MKGGMESMKTFYYSAYARTLCLLLMVVVSPYEGCDTEFLSGGNGSPSKVWGIPSPSTVPPAYRQSIIFWLPMVTVQNFQCCLQ